MTDAAETIKAIGRMSAEEYVLGTLFRTGERQFVQCHQRWLFGKFRNHQRNKVFSGPGKCCKRCAPIKAADKPNESEGVRKDRL